MVAVKPLWARFLSDDGAEFVEFALAFPLLLVVVLGIMDMGIMFQQYQVITAAAREGARVGVLPYHTASDAEDRADEYVAASILAMGNTAPLALATVTPGVPIPGGGCTMSTMTVTTSFPHQYLFVGQRLAYFGGNALGTKTLNASATMRMEQTAACP
jgi:Flp pilus assembly protein TadG